MLPAHLVCQRLCIRHQRIHHLLPLLLRSREAQAASVEARHPACSWGAHSCPTAAASNDTAVEVPVSCTSRRRLYGWGRSCGSSAAIAASEAASLGDGLMASEGSGTKAAR